MADRNPKMEFKSNIPETITLIKQPPKFKGVYEDKNWWGWEVSHNGTEKTLFADEKLQPLIQPYEGKTIVIAWEEQSNKDTGKKYHRWKVNQALFDHDGKLPPEPLLSIATNEQARGQWKQDVVKVFEEMLFEAAGIAERFNSNPIASDGFKLDHEDVRAMAISMVIQYQRDK
jgi:hypothetical protein